MKCSDHCKIWSYFLLEMTIYFKETATYVHTDDARVAEFICKQIREVCRVSKDIKSRTEYFVRDAIFDGQRKPKVNIFFF